MPRKKKTVEEIPEQLEFKIGSVISTDYLVISSEPKVGSPICQKITKKADIKIIGESADWYLVKYKTVCGYVPKTML